MQQHRVATLFILQNISLQFYSAMTFKTDETENPVNIKFHFIEYGNSFVIKIGTNPQLFSSLVTES
jgi:hypothetical protein